MRNRDALLLSHFFGDTEALLKPPSVETGLANGKLSVIVTFPEGSAVENGRIWWMYDRAPDGSDAYIRDMIPDDNWRDMESDERKKVWTAEIRLDPEASHIDFFSSHRKTVEHNSGIYPTCISGPYTRITLRKK